MNNNNNNQVTARTAEKYNMMFRILTMLTQNFTNMDFEIPISTILIYIHVERVNTFFDGMIHRIHTKCDRELFIFGVLYLRFMFFNVKKICVCVYLKSY